MRFQSIALMFNILLLYFLSSTNIGVEAIKIDLYQKNTASQNESVVLYKFMNREYYGYLGLGKPSVQFRFIFDTAWSDMYVPSKHCGFMEVACLMHTQYDSSRSSTFQENGKPINLTSKDMSIRGFLSTDNVHLSHIQIVNQTFIEATHLSMDPFLYNKADGVIGLGFSSSTDPKPFFYNMMAQGLVKDPIFTFYMNRDETTEKAGSLILGGTAREHVKGKITKIPTVDKNEWRVKIDRIVVVAHDKSHVFGEGSTGLFDTSGNGIKGPSDESNRINDLLHAYNTGIQGLFMVNCREYAKLPDIEIVLSGRNFTIQSKYYVQRMTFQGVEACFTPFRSYDSGKTWLLGGAFLMQFYTEFNLKEASVSIAQTIF